MVDLGTLLKQASALRETARTNEDAFAEYRRLMRAQNAFASALDRIRRRDVYGSLQEEVDSMRAIAQDAWVKVHGSDGDGE